MLSRTQESSAGLRICGTLARTTRRATDQALIIDRRLGEGPGARLLGWGLPVEWDAKPLINARAETLAEKKTFQPLLDARCLVPATAYFEWRKASAGKLKNRIAPSDGGLFAFAGLMDGRRFTIITCRPAPEIAHIHGRMPVILDRRAEPKWIDPGVPCVPDESFFDYSP